MVEISQDARRNVHILCCRWRTSSTCGQMKAAIQHPLASEGFPDLSIVQRQLGDGLHLQRAAQLRLGSERTRVAAECILCMQMMLCTYRARNSPIVT